MSPALIRHEFIVCGCFHIGGEVVGKKRERERGGGAPWWGLLAKGWIRDSLEKFAWREHFLFWIPGSEEESNYLARDGSLRLRS